MASHIDFLLSSLIVVIAIFALFFLARIVRFVFNFIRYLYLSFKYSTPASYKRDARKYKKPPKFNKNDFKRRDKKHEIQLAKAQHQDQTTDVDLYEETKIVGIAEPIGKWTKFVTNQKISWLQAMVGSKMDSDNFWQNMIKAQQKAASKHKGKSGPSM